MRYGIRELDMILEEFYRKKKKVVGSKKALSSFAGEQYKVTIYIHGTPYINKKLFQRFCADLKRGLKFSGGVRTHPFPPVVMPLEEVDVG